MKSVIENSSFYVLIRTIALSEALRSWLEHSMSAVRVLYERTMDIRWVLDHCCIPVSSGALWLPPIQCSLHCSVWTSAISFPSPQWSRLQRSSLPYSRMQQNWHEETSPRTFKSFLFPGTQSPSSGGVGKSCDTFWKALMFYFRSIIGFFDQKSLNKELRIGLFIKWGWRSRGGFLVPILLHSRVPKYQEDL